ncbi:hypothetical protein IGI04_006755 [Brassica rapa subsp. trilocularis]|uniref:Uncharacterized protein n=1 Tax=Brassica rapa subsp. trilocularis TaxID=1813537 RepID=A0ABQ7NJY3_BRACM|nr:hypothetical protein IGI04_006755 [Brassica rapa subsp. trilocularis]
MGAVFVRGTESINGLCWRRSRVTSRGSTDEIDSYGNMTLHELGKIIAMVDKEKGN